jgi:hypothetical protein
MYRLFAKNCRVEQIPALLKLAILIVVRRDGGKVGQPYLSLYPLILGDSQGVFSSFGLVARVRLDLSCIGAARPRFDLSWPSTKMFRFASSPNQLYFCRRLIPDEGILRLSRTRPCGLDGSFGPAETYRLCRDHAVRRAAFEGARASATVRICGDPLVLTL